MFNRGSFRLLSRATVVGAAVSSQNYIAFNDEKNIKKPSLNSKVVIIGGGTAGIGMAALLKNKGVKNITIVEPSNSHYYQPMWTLVGAGLKPAKDSVRNEADIIPHGVHLVKTSAKSFKPEENKVELADGSYIDYDFLIVSAGIQVDWNKIPGLVDALGKPESGVVSIYDYNYSQRTLTAIEGFKSGRAIFTFPATLIKCAGAPQKIMWLFEERMRDLGLREKTSVEYWCPGEALFGIKRYADMLEILRQERNVKACYKKELVKVDGDKKIATFKNLVDGTLQDENFDLLHVCPPMSAPDFIKSSPLAAPSGWMDVDKHTLRSTTYSNIFGLGDCTNTPNSKTAAAITAQAPVVVHNLMHILQNKEGELDGHYTGYASCPLVIGKHKVILAEFGYDGKIMETFHGDMGKFPCCLLGQEGSFSQMVFAVMKKELFPFAYWNLWTRGMWFGTNGPFEPDVRRKEDQK